MTEFKSGVDLTLMEGVLRQYQEDSTSLIMILQRAQSIYGYLPQEVIYHVAARTGNSPAKVLGVATFYSYFRLEPMGTYQIMLCQGTACHVNGAERIRTAITQELGIVNGQTTEDGMFTLNEVACLGCCSLAPVMMINGDTYGKLTPESTIKILRELKKREEGGGIRILVGQGSCGVSAGAARVAKVLSGHMTATDSFTVEKTGCIGMCYLEPIVDIYEGDKLLHRLVHVNEVDALGIVEAVRKKDFSKLESMFISDDDARFLKKQKRVALRHCGVIDPTSIDDYIRHDGYQALDKALRMTPEEVIEEIKVSGLAGRGGAGFPTWFKWNAARQAPGESKHLICNADEGDPGAFMDRAVIESDPHSLIEGMLIGAYAIGAKDMFVYIRAEYPLAVEHLGKAIEEARARGLLGENILGTGFSCDLEIKTGAGAFVCGEETALIESMEGKRGMPRLKPPFPAVSGYLNEPSNINNVETFANVAWIIKNGGAAFSAMGTENSKGTKVFALTGKVQRGGLVEVPMGNTLKDVIFDIAGGIKDGHQYKAVQMGGPSGGCIPASMRGHHGLRRHGGHGRHHLYGEHRPVLPGLHRQGILRQVRPLPHRHHPYDGDPQPHLRGPGPGRGHRAAGGAVRGHQGRRPLRPGPDGPQPRPHHHPVLPGRVRGPHPGQEMSRLRVLRPADHHHRRREVQGLHPLRPEMSRGMYLRRAEGSPRH